MRLDLRKIITIAVPALVIAFVVFSFTGKVAVSLTGDTDEVAVIKKKEVFPVLRELLKENQKRFDRYNRRDYHGLPVTEIIDHAVIRLEYTAEAGPYDVEKGKANASEQFKRLMCRYPEFKKLYAIQNRILSEFDETVKISVDVAAYDSSQEKLLWEISITPKMCL